jgi:hypothetical protein
MKRIKYLKKLGIAQFSLTFVSFSYDGIQTKQDRRLLVRTGSLLTVEV